MNFSFENQGSHTYLVYTVAEGDSLDTMSLGMLTNNKISGLTQTIFTQMDNTKYIKYDVSSKISAKQFFTGQVNKKRLLGVFNGIADAILAVEEYMIDASSLVFDLEYIFTDVSTGETLLVCLPISADKSTKSDLVAFFKNIMFTTQFDQSENCDHVAKIINYLNSSVVFSPESFKKLLGSLETDGAIQSQPQVVRATNVQPQREVPQPVRASTVQPQPQVKDKNVVSKQVAVPQEKKKEELTKKTAFVSEEKEKKLSFLWLCMHYSKENSKLYSEQKAKNKALNENSAPKEQNKKSKKAEGFEVPNQKKSSVSGFAIPGQQETIQAVADPQKNATPLTPTVSAVNVAEKTTFVPQTVSSGTPMNFGETTVLGGSVGETTVLGVSEISAASPHLIRTKNKERININKPVFRIGKEKSYVDYFIGDNSAISRSHANIIVRDGDYFVVDTNSTNHTYVNGQMLQSNIEQKITHGSKLRFANEDFEFRTY